MAYSITNIDPSIIKALYESLPSGPQAFTINDNPRQFKWEYTVVFISVIEELKPMLHDYPHVVLDAYRIKLSPFWHVCNYMGYFENFVKFFPDAQSPSVKITEEFLNSMLEALTKDISKFGDQAPAHLFFSFEQWKIYEAKRMMQEMKLEPIDPYENVLSLYKSYQNYRRRYEDNVAMDRLKMCYNGFQSTMCLMTLMQRINDLEARLQTLEAEIRK